MIFCNCFNRAFVINVILLTRLNRARLRKSQTVLSLVNVIASMKFKIYFCYLLLISDTIFITNTNLILLYIKLIQMLTNREISNLISVFLVCSLYLIFKFSTVFLVVDGSPFDLF